MSTHQSVSMYYKRMARSHNASSGNQSQQADAQSASSSNPAVTTNHCPTGNETDLSRESHSNLSSASSSCSMSPGSKRYSRTRSKSYGGQKLPSSSRPISQNATEPESESVSGSSGIFGSFGRISTQNLSLLPNLQSVLPDYLTSAVKSAQSNAYMPTLPTLNLPLAMPQMSFSDVSFPTLPNLSMPSITIPSIPSIPSMPALSIPSISEIMSFPGRKNPKSWAEICATVRESRERFAEISPPMPYCINIRTLPPSPGKNTSRLRIYFLASPQNIGENALFYCDIDSPQMPEASFEEESAQEASNSGKTHRRQPSTGVFDIDFNEDVDDEEMMNIEEMQQSHRSHEHNEEAEEDEERVHMLDKIDFIGQHAAKVMRRNSSSSSSSSESFQLSPSPSPFMEHEDATPAINSAIHSHRRQPSGQIFDYSHPRNLASPTSSVPELEALQWQLLLTSGRTHIRVSNNSGEQTVREEPTGTSREEDLILERKRLPSTGGLVSYSFHPGQGRFVYAINNILYWFDDNCDQTENAQPIIPNRFSSQILTYSYPKLNATICPGNANFVAYVARDDLWVIELRSGDEQRLTMTNRLKHASAGYSSFVMQEEFSRYEGFWWRPPPPDAEEPSNTQSILVEFLDQHQVSVTMLSSWSIDGQAEPHYFPRAGETNPFSSLALVSFTYQEGPIQTRWNSIKIEHLPVLTDIFSQAEYLVKVGWLNYDVVWLQLLNRRQTHLVLALVSISNSFPPQILIDEFSTTDPPNLAPDGWVNCHNNLYFFDPESVRSPGDKVVFVWSSERSGFRHLYKVTAKLAAPNLPHPSPNKDTYAETVSVQQLTSGQWEVHADYLWVDERRQLIYFLGNKETPLESHLYCISSNQTQTSMPRRVTQEDYTHGRVWFDDNFDFCIDFLSNLSKPTFALLHRVSYGPTQSNQNLAQYVSFEPIYYFLAPTPEDVHLGFPDGPPGVEGQFLGQEIEDNSSLCRYGAVPVLFECKLDSGELCYGFYFKPNFVEPGVKYPVLLDIYGGPEIQVVSKSFKDVRQHRRHLLASEGYIVVGFDSRGSKNRGVAFERYIHKRLGQVEIEDQVRILQWLAEKTGFIDMNRVAIHGWSYGGYLSLMALVQRPDIFKCAIAGAPVTNWELYDTAYTERYMGLPSENPEGYRKSSVVNHARFFPDEPNRLLIIHGLMDENVHFSHTAQLINVLVKFGKPYNLNVFPFERHCVRKSYSSEHYEATLLYFLQQNL